MKEISAILFLFDKCPAGTVFY